MSCGSCPRLAGFRAPRATVDTTARAAILNHMVKFSDAAPRPHFCRAVRPDAARAGDAACRRAGSFGERACRAVCDVAAGGHEASRRVVRCRARRAHQDRARRRLPARRRADARRVRMAQPLRKVLVRAAVQPRRIFGRRRRKIMATQTATKPSLTLKRRLKAPPAKVFAAWTDPEKVKALDGAGRASKCCSVECDAARRRPLSLGDAGAERRRARRQRRLSRIRSRTRSSSSPGPGRRTPERESLVTVRDQARRRRHVADADA